VRRGCLPGIDRDATVFWRRDRSDVDPGLRHPGQFRRRQQALLDSADVVCGVTAGLVEGAARPDRPAVVVPNGCDTAHFARPQPIPPELEALPRPLVGFAGGVSWRLDVDLVATIARDHPEWSVVLVGEQTRPLPSIPNLHAFGRSDYRKLPAYIQAFDVGLVPYVEDEFNRAAFPLKVFEYLAAGVPVVGVPLPALESLSGAVVRTARGADAFGRAIADLLSQRPSVQDCRQLVDGNSWDDRAVQIETLVAAAVSRHHAPAGGD
jgi:glycosyltransferase involved in cell wall biosynthesis